MIPPTSVVSSAARMRDLNQTSGVPASASEMLGRHDRLHSHCRHIRMMRREHTYLFGGGWVAHTDFEQESVELCFGQGIGAFLLDRVLGGENREPLPERVSGAVDRRGPFLHRFKQCGLRLRRRAVDLVDEQQVGEERPVVVARDVGGEEGADRRRPGAR